MSINIDHTTDTLTPSGGVLNVAGALASVRARRLAYSRQTPTTGFSVTIADDVEALVLVPAGTLLTGTVTMPASPEDGQIVRISCTQQITVLTLSPNSGQTMVGALTTILALGSAEYIYELPNTRWVRIG